MSLRDIEVPLASLSRHQQFRFLSLCGIDLESAKLAVKLATFELGPTQITKRMVFQALSEVAVVRYSRPFAASKIAAGKKTRLPSEYLNVFSPQQRALHEKLCTLRNTTAAHTQGKGRRMKHIRIPGLYGKPPETISQLRIRCATPTQLKKMLALIEMLDAKIRAKRTPVVPKH